MSHYDRYFSKRQIGRGVDDIGRVYRAPQFHFQRGRGLSDVFGGIIKFITPYLISSSKALGKEALRSGSEILGNLGTKPIGELLKQQKDKSISNLAQKTGNKLKRMGEEMSGEGIKRRKRNTASVITGLMRAENARTKKKGWKRKTTTVKTKKKTKKTSSAKKADF